MAKLISPDGDYIGAGQAYFTTNLAEIELAGTLEHVNIVFAGFFIDLDPPGGELLSVGHYPGPPRRPHSGLLSHA